MKRALAVATVLAAPLLLAPLTTGAAGAAQPRMYHTIGSTSASATLSSTAGCELTEVFVSSSKAMYAAQPGPVGKQGLTAVFVRVSDTCSTDQTKWHCIEVPRPGVEGFFPCFGFPA
ncbi:hypothetical protein [Terrabacter sp. C0L_2]|jgi:hypothetical protein|uniref:hypothetical protein n=1 Tax=Terrabacter sp. C0L_2 TaxID=3108389 RepID=UPI002ED1FFF7|nr:hypothetical protein U5C87_03475 [Terrabacter sp. C0L_2]